MRITIKGNTGDYIVSWNSDYEVFQCTCPHYRFRLRRIGGQCKHIDLAIKLGFEKEGGFSMNKVIQRMKEVDV